MVMLRSACRLLMVCIKTVGIVANTKLIFMPCLKLLLSHSLVLSGTDFAWRLAQVNPMGLVNLGMWPENLVRQKTAAILTSTDYDWPGGKHGLAMT
jgi:hypothetical protein